MSNLWNKINIPRKILKNLYEDQGLPIAQIASKLGYSTTPIHRLLREYKIKTRSISEAKKKFEISKQELRNLYHKQKLSTGQIAQKYGCNHVTIVNRMKKYSIESRGHLGLTKPIRISKEKLKYLYKKRSLSLAKIARIIHRSEGGIERKFKSYGIRSRGLDNRTSKYKKRNFDGNLLEKAYMIGFRLGDLNVFSPKNIICVRCSSTKKAQIRLIRNLFKKYGGIYQALAPRGTFEICCFLNKSFEFLLPKEDKIEEWILSNKNYFLSFLAGYVDAEGSFYLRKPYYKLGKIGWAIFELQTYDKNIIDTISHFLYDLGVENKFFLSRKQGYMNKQGFKNKKDLWRLAITKKVALWKFTKLIEPYQRHTEKIKDLMKIKKNLIQRNSLPYCHPIDLS